MALWPHQVLDSEPHCSHLSEGPCPKRIRTPGRATITALGLLLDRGHVLTRFNGGQSRAVCKGAISLGSWSEGCGLSGLTCSPEL